MVSFWYVLNLFWFSLYSEIEVKEVEDSKRICTFNSYKNSEKL